MLMTTTGLIVQRVYGCTLGRIPWVADWIEWAVLNLLIRARSSRFVPEAGFFTPDQLDD